MPSINDPFPNLPKVVTSLREENSNREENSKTMQALVKPPSNNNLLVTNVPVTKAPQ